jgi:hypothetical protein
MMWGCCCWVGSHPSIHPSIRPSIHLSRYTYVPPEGSPLYRIYQVLAGAVRNRKLALPASADELYGELTTMMMTILGSSESRLLRLTI